MRRAKNDVRDLTDEVLAKAKDGDHAAQELVFRVTEGLIRWRANKYRGDHDTHEDLMSIGRLAVFDALRTFKPGKGRFLAWMTQWVHARMWAKTKSSMIRAAYTEEFSREGHELLPGADEQLSADETARSVRVAVNRLPPRLKLIVQRRMEGEHLAAIGREMSLSRERVRQLEAEAHAKLRRTLEAA